MPFKKFVKRCWPALALLLLVTADSPAVEPDPHLFPTDAKAILQGAKEIELFSIDPNRSEEKAIEEFQGRRVLGKTVIKEEKARKAFVAALEKGVTEYKGGPAKCFNPRHGIRVKHDGKTVDFVICFECYQVRALYGDEGQSFLVSRSPAELFNKILKDAGVELPKSE